MTRNCPPATSNSPIPGSFFTTRSELVPGLTVYSCLPENRVRTCLAILDLADLDHILATEATSASVLNLLSPEEKEILAGYAYPKRRSEWQGGRLAGKTCVHMLWSASLPPGLFSTVSILPAANGSPILSCSPLPQYRVPALSISHSRGYGVAMAAMATSCGIDIQQITAQTVRVADRFSEPAEIQLLKDCLPEMNTAALLTLLWSGKEALKKSLLNDQPIIFQGVKLLSASHDHHISLTFSCPAEAPARADVTALILGEYALAFTVSGKDHA